MYDRDNCFHNNGAKLASSLKNANGLKHALASPQQTGKATTDKPKAQPSGKPLTSDGKSR